MYRGKQPQTRTIGQSEFYSVYTEAVWLTLYNPSCPTDAINSNNIGVPKTTSVCSTAFFLKSTALWETILYINMAFVSIHNQKQWATFLQNALQLLHILNFLPEILLLWEYETKFRELHLVYQMHSRHGLLQHRHCECSDSVWLKLPDKRYVGNLLHRQFLKYSVFYISQVPITV